MEAKSKTFDIKKMPNNQHTSHINFFIHPSTHNALKEVAVDLGVPVSRLARHAIEAYLFSLENQEEN